jgi:hypothetical protein
MIVYWAMKFSESIGPAAVFTAVGLLCAGVVVSDTNPPGSGKHESRLGELEEAGMEDIAPHEFNAARAFLKAFKKHEAEGSRHAVRYEKLLGLQLDLIEAIMKSSKIQLEAKEAEKTSYEAYMEMKKEKAAYEYLIDQILAGGLVSQWAVP